ncbi:MAG: AAC(3) family N-acetyltransferase [Deltaproteobacteria bacterium]|nr:AAC(3) family N-acetyltransferase [Deltaproteobacteria bacterium]
MSAIPPRSAADLAADLARLGVAPGDALMVHASLRRIGAGAATVIDAIDRAVGSDGTWMMVLGAVIEHEWVNEHPEADREALLADAPPWDRLAAPALASEVGYLAEAFRVAPGTVVSDNPSGRFGARGRLAEAFVREAPWHDYYGVGSPLERLCRAGGKVLRMGANPDTTTVLHHAEYLATMPHKRRVTRHYKVRDGDGEVRVRAISCLDDEHGLVDFPRASDPPGAWPHDDYFAVILGAYLALGRHASGPIGGADSHLLDAADLVAFGADWMSRHLA